MINWEKNKEIYGNSNFLLSAKCRYVSDLHIITK